MKRFNYKSVFPANSDFFLKKNHIILLYSDEQFDEMKKHNKHKTASERVDFLEGVVIGTITCIL